MKIVVAGIGKVGALLTQKLTLDGHDLTLIDINPDVLDEAIDKFDVMSLEGNCASMDVLLHSEIKKAEVLIAVTGKDEINLLCCMTAHNINPSLHTVARIRNPEYTNQIYKMRDVFGLSMVINPEKQAALEVERLIRYPGFLRRDTFAKGKVEIVELRVDANSKLKDVSLYNLNSVVGCSCLVCAVSRGGKAMIPAGDFVIEEGDRIYVTAPAENLTAMLSNLGIITHRAKKVILCGGGNVNYYLAKKLSAKKKVSVELIENDMEKCKYLANLLPDVNVVCGDASNQEYLDNEGISECDALVSMTGLDEMNMIISLYGMLCKVPQIITKVDHTNNSGILDSLSLGSIICPKEICCTNIVSYVRAMQNKTGAALAVHYIAEGQAEAMEFRVDKDTLNQGKKLRDLKLKKGVLIVCISREGVTEIPDGNSSFRENDTLIVVSSAQTILRKLDDIFV